MVENYVKGAQAWTRGKKSIFLSIDLGQNKKIAGGCYWAHMYTYNVFFEKF